MIELSTDILASRLSGLTIDQVRAERIAIGGKVSEWMRAKGFDDWPIDPAESYKRMLVVGRRRSPGRAWE